MLELLITIAIVGIVFTVGARSGLSSWSVKRDARNTFTTLVSEIETLKNQALGQNTTTRMTLVNVGDVYTLTTFLSSAPVTTCTSAGTWTTIFSKEVNVHETYEITGTAMANLCFNRDGSSSGGTLSIAPQDSSSTHTTYDLDVTISTGFIDVTES